MISDDHGEFIPLFGACLFDEVASFVGAYVGFDGGEDGAGLPGGHVFVHAPVGVAAGVGDGCADDGGGRGGWLATSAAARIPPLVSGGGHGLTGVQVLPWSAVFIRCPVHPIVRDTRIPSTATCGGCGGGGGVGMNWCAHDAFATSMSALACARVMFVPGTKVCGLDAGSPYWTYTQAGFAASLASASACD